MKRTVNDDMVDFLSLAHDLNNILATISGYSELLLEDLPKSSASYQHAGKIKTAAGRAGFLISSVLADNIDQQQNKASTSVYDVLKETIGFVKSTAPGNVTIRSRLNHTGISVSADPSQLFRAFLNLLTNAIQSLEGRKGNVTVSLTESSSLSIEKVPGREPVSDKYAVVRISDTGKGIDPLMLDKIFEPFFTTRKNREGSGLGLSVVRNIVSEMGGRISVSSIRNKGSIFYLYLPVSPVEIK